MIRMFFAICMVLALAGCDSVDTLRSGMANGSKVSADIKKAVGVEPFVGYNWNNGSLTNVSLTFQQVPDNLDWSVLEATSRASIKKHFKQVPNAIVISFMLPGKVAGQSEQADHKTPI